MNRHLPLFLVCCGSFAALFAGSLSAQAPSPSPPRPDRSVASPRPLSTPCGRHVDVCDVLDHYASLTKFKIIRDNFVQGMVGLDDVTTLPPAKAIEIIERSLFGDGFSIIQIAPDTVEIMDVPDAKKEP